MNDMYKDVADFHKKFNVPGVAGTEPCRIPDYQILEYRTKFLEEELQEFKDAQAAGSLVEMLDALADIVWVALGTAHYFKAPFDQVWAEVRRANNERVLATPETCPPNKKYRSDLIMKPEGWEPPRIRAVIAAYNKEMKLLDAQEVAQLGAGSPIDISVPIIGVINVDNPADPRHKEWLEMPEDLSTKDHPLGCDCDICESERNHP